MSRVFEHNWKRSKKKLNQVSRQFRVPFNHWTTHHSTTTCWCWENTYTFASSWLPTEGTRSYAWMLLFVGCLTSRQHASVSQGRNAWMPRLNRSKSMKYVWSVWLKTDKASCILTIVGSHKLTEEKGTNLMSDFKLYCVPLTHFTTRWACDFLCKL